MKTWIFACGALAMALVASGPGYAQSDSAQPDYVQPAGARGQMLHEACAADIQTFCAEVEKGGGRIMQCIRQHRDQLSDSCKTAVAQARANHHPPRETPSDSIPATPAPPEG